MYMANISSAFAALRVVNDAWAETPTSPSLVLGVLSVAGALRARARVVHRATWMRSRCVVRAADAVPTAGRILAGFVLWHAERSEIYMLRRPSSVVLVAGASVAAGVVIARRLRRLSNSVTVGRVDLPYELCGPPTAPVDIVVSHGLGSSGPSTKSHADDASRSVLLPAIIAAGRRGVWYTARGHGVSHVWEDGSTDQFLWPRLAEELLAVAEQLCSARTFIVAGNSMGAATALCAALQSPERVAGVILYRVPTIWETRAARRDALLAKVDALRAARGVE